jgi:hypothetical protein
MYYNIYLISINNKPFAGYPMQCNPIQCSIPSRTSRTPCYERTPNNAVDLTKQTALTWPSYSQSSHLTTLQIMTTILFPRP